MGPPTARSLIALLVTTDGRRTCLERTLGSFAAATNDQHIGLRVVINDCVENPDFTDWVDTLGFDIHIRPEAHRRGFAGAVNAGWAALNDALHPTDHVFHVEDDFLFCRHVDLRAMAAIIDADPHLAQMALRRQPWNETEQVAGGIIEVNPGAYTDCSDGVHHWLEHRQFFTTNPSLYRLDLTERGWPTGAESEGRFGLRLFEDPAVRCAFWGQRSDPPWVLHIGAVRMGTGY